MMQDKKEKHFVGVLLYVFHGGFTAAFSFIMFDRCFPGFFTANLVLFTYDIVVDRTLDADALLKLYAVLWAFIGGGLGSLTYEKYSRKNLQPHHILQKMALVEMSIVCVFTLTAILYQIYSTMRSDWLVFFLATGLFFCGGWQFQAVSSWNNIPLRTNMMSGNILALSKSLFNAIRMRITGKHKVFAEEFYDDFRRIWVILGFAFIFVLGSALAFTVVPTMKFYASVFMVINCLFAIMACYESTH